MWPPRPQENHDGTFRIRSGAKRRPWNAGLKLGAKRALKPRQVWAVRFRLDQDRRFRDRALFDHAIDSKLRGCDVVKMKIGDLVSGDRIRSRALVVQQKTGWPVQFELLDSARSSILAWLERRGGTIDGFVFPSRIDRHPSYQYPPICSARGRVGVRKGIPNQTSVAMAYKEFENGRMKPSAHYNRIVDVMKELVRFTVLLRPARDPTHRRYPEQKEEAAKVEARLLADTR